MRPRHDRSPYVRTALAAVVATVLGGTAFTAWSARADAEAGAELFPKDYHPLIPMLPRETTQISAGALTGEALEQPIAFPHDRHVQMDGISCEYCHNAARNSIHAGVPEIQTCMGCHRYVLKDSPEIKLLTEYWNRKEPVPWARVHDLPDFVYFSHMRHVRGGVQCTECHGQVQTMAGRREPPVTAHGEGDGHGEAAVAHDPTNAAEAREVLGPAVDTMTRESTLQMGWCLDCHGSHPSIDENYGDKANLRRAELKDCWTCHK